MRNKILAAFWMVVGGLAAFYIGMIPISWVDAFVGRFIGNDSLIRAIPILASALLLAAYGAYWFKCLFYKGTLWGYRPDRDS
jgi:hypothetical protein